MLRCASLVDVQREGERVRDGATGGGHGDDLVRDHGRSGVGGPGGPGASASTAASAGGNPDQERERQHGGGELPAAAARLNCPREERSAQEQNADRTGGGAPS